MNASTASRSGRTWSGTSKLMVSPGRSSESEVGQVGHAIRGPQGGRRLDHSAQLEEHAVVVDAPAGEVPPALVAVGLQRDPGGPQLLVDAVELGPVDRDGV